MADVYGDTAGFPEARDSAAPIDQGRLGGLFCQLFRRQFTGMLRVESSTRVALIGFRAGQPVNIEDSSPGAALGDQLVERGLITRAQYAAVIARVTEGLVDNEDVAFCEHAVALGFLAEERAHEELSERTRTRLLQALSWSECRVTFDDTDDAWLGQGEYPQQPGALVYMGVRTFYDEQLLRGYVPDPARYYLRLLASVAKIGEFFALDDDELKLLRALDPQSPIATLVGASIVDPAHAIALVALLSLAGLCEFSSTPFAPPEADRSGTRPAPAQRAERSHSYAGTPATQAARPASQTTMQAVRATRQPSQALVMPSTSLAEQPYARSAPARQGQGSKSQLSPQEQPVRAPGNVADATQEALREAAARASRHGRRPVTPLAQRAVREPEVVRPAAARPKVQEPPTSAPDPAQRAEYAKAHLNELLQRRRQTLQQPAPATAKRDPTRTLRQAQELVRDQHYARAEELVRELLEQEPGNELFRAHYLWAKFRAQPDGEAQAGELLDLAKKLVQVPEHGAFACYVLAHLYLAAKKDELAEKYFRRALTADKTNKDAERYVLILERRKQQAAEAETTSNRKIFGISIAGKPKT
jgi:tetratricopeptide (TPR) repeat protein